MTHERVLIIVLIRERAFRVWKPGFGRFPVNEIRLLITKEENSFYLRKKVKLNGNTAARQVIQFKLLVTSSSLICLPQCLNTRVSAMCRSMVYLRHTTTAYHYGLLLRHITMELSLWCITQSVRQPMLLHVGQHGNQTALLSQIHKSMGLVHEIHQSPCTSASDSVVQIGFLVCGTHSGWTAWASRAHPFSEFQTLNCSIEQPRTSSFERAASNFKDASLNRRENVRNS